MGIPFAIFATCGVLYFAGETLNMLTLFSFLMALGILVDDAIVISENYHTHRTMGHSPVKSAIAATSEVAGSVTTGVLCTVIAFVPLFFVSGIMGKFIACMPLTVIAMLLISLVEGLTILACHLGHDNMLGEMIETLKRLQKSVGQWHVVHRCLFGWLIWCSTWIAAQLLQSYLSLFCLFKRLFDWINVWSDGFVNYSVGRLYLPAVRRSLQNIPLTLSIAAAFLIFSATGFSGGWVKQTLFPSLDSRFIFASVTFPDGTPIEVTDDAVKKIANGIRQVSNQRSENGVPLATLVQEIVGGAAEFSNNPTRGRAGESTGTVVVELCGSGERNLHSREIIDLWRQATGVIVGTEDLNFDSASMGPGGKQIEFKLLANSQDWDKLVQAAEKVTAHMRGYRTVADINDDLFEGKWEYHIRVNDRASGMGVSTAELAETIRASFFGQEVMRLQRGRHEVKLMVRYPKNDRENLATLENIRVRGSDNVERPISELAEIKLLRGYQSIRRVDQKRAITISGDVKPGGNSEEVLAELEKTFMPEVLRKYPGVSVKWEGQRQQDAESTTSLAIGAVCAIFMMYLLLVLNMKSLFEPLIILFVIPFALCGAFWGHYLMGLELTLFSFFGFVALTGLVVNDSIVLLDFINLRIRENPGEPLIESIVEAGRRRIRPMALNTVTSIIGIVPLVSNTSMQAQVLVPMGVSLVFGLVASTALGLFIVPILFYTLAQVMPPEATETEVKDNELAATSTVDTFHWTEQSGTFKQAGNIDATQGNGKNEMSKNGNSSGVDLVHQYPSGSHDDQ
jgi:multidrug efflux pump subunit AcrB